MKVVILAGGYGTRLTEETTVRPKPMVEIGGMPILWHIMSYYYSYGFNEFIICLGYKGSIIKEYFLEYSKIFNSLFIDTAMDSVEVLDGKRIDWKIWLIDTGLNTMTGGRMKRISQYIPDDNFMMTYGDGLSDVDLSELLKFHKKHGKLVTLTAVQPEGRFGALNISENGKVKDMIEKPSGDGGWINGGFFVINKNALNVIEEDNSIWEQDSLQIISKKHELMAFRHRGFWKSMDTLSDKISLEKIWNSGKAPWKTW